MSFCLIWDQPSLKYERSAPSGDDITELNAVSFAIYHVDDIGIILNIYLKYGIILEAYW